MTATPPSNDLWSTIAQLNDLAQASPDRTDWTWTADTTRRDLEADLVSLQPAWNRLFASMPLPQFVTMAKRSEIEREHTRIHLAWFGVPTAVASSLPRLPNREFADPIRPFPVYTWRMTWVFHPTSQVLLDCFVSCQDPSGHYRLIWDEPGRMQWDPSTTTLPCQATMAWTDEALEDCLITRPDQTPEPLSHLILPLFHDMLATRSLWDTLENRQRWSRHLRRFRRRERWHETFLHRLKPFLPRLLLASVLNVVVDGIIIAYGHPLSIGIAWALLANSVILGLLVRIPRQHQSP